MPAFRPAESTFKWRNWITPPLAFAVLFAGIYRIYEKGSFENSDIFWVFLGIGLGILLLRLTIFVGLGIEKLQFRLKKWQLERYKKSVSRMARLPEVDLESREFDQAAFNHEIDRLKEVAVLAAKSKPLDLIIVMVSQNSAAAA